MAKDTPCVSAIWTPTNVAPRNIPAVSEPLGQHAVEMLDVAKHQLSSEPCTSRTAKCQQLARAEDNHAMLSLQGMQFDRTWNRANKGKGKVGSYHSKESQKQHIVAGLEAGLGADASWGSEHGLRQHHGGGEEGQL